MVAHCLRQADQCAVGAVDYRYQYPVEEHQSHESDNPGKK
jgi:hypothetical protein